MRRALSEAKKERTPEWRSTENSPGSFAAPAWNVWLCAHPRRSRVPIFLRQKSDIGASSFAVAKLRLNQD